MPGCEGFPAFLLTRKGLVMVAEMLTIFIAVVCQAVSGGCYITVPIAELVLLIIMFVVFVKELYATYGTVNWYWCDFFRAAIGCPLFLITSSICLSYARTRSEFVAGGILGVVSGVLLGCDAVLAFTLIGDKKQEQPQANFGQVIIF
ncbi:proteolipid protein 2-like isoform X1 [Denticeps clupeoides]|uniref:proteolipid protein 2-like isoform X1 n=1 Tax=Denticeps clupeoides TaxID=299321 RepID=UPI0010A4CE59|nr:proteolipid protein 2-like isoform X1 [Denticeps clupeoides]